MTAYRRKEQMYRSVNLRLCPNFQEEKALILRTVLFLHRKVRRYLFDFTITIYHKAHRQQEASCLLVWEPSLETNCRLSGSENA